MEDKLSQNEDEDFVNEILSSNSIEIAMNHITENFQQPSYRKIVINLKKSFSKK